jgi:small subunit ribosomal protein S9
MVDKEVQDSKIPFNLGRKHLSAVGRRKTAVARVRLYKGEGKFFVNEQEMKEYFPTAELQQTASNALKNASLEKNFDISAKVNGGGKNAQAEAIRLAISRNLIHFDEKLKPSLKHAGFLSRDPRKKERKKYGMKSARRAPQFAKR